MKHYGLSLIASLLLMSGCTNTSKTPAHFCATPINNRLSLDSLPDGDVAASFTADDINWRGGNLTMTVYCAYQYNAADIARLQVGDTIVYEGDKPLPVDSIERRDKYVIINGGIKAGGAELTPINGNTYRATSMDDHSVYKELGKCNVVLAQDFTFIDCRTEPTDPNDTIRSAQKPYFEKLKDYRRQFSPLDTRVTIKHGIVTEIHRHWTP